MTRWRSADSVWCSWSGAATAPMRKCCSPTRPSSRGSHRYSTRTPLPVSSRRAHCSRTAAGSSPRNAPLHKMNTACPGTRRSRRKSCGKYTSRWYCTRHCRRENVEGGGRLASCFRAADGAVNAIPTAIANTKTIYARAVRITHSSRGHGALPRAVDASRGGGGGVRHVTSRSRRDVQQPPTSHIIWRHGPCAAPQQRGMGRLTVIAWEKLRQYSQR
jgi:hypothetical protein